MSQENKPKFKYVKHWNFFFKFPTAKAAHAQQIVSVDAPNLGKATKTAWEIIKKRQGIKGCKLEQGSISWTVETTKVQV